MAASRKQVKRKSVAGELHRQIGAVISAADDDEAVFRVAEVAALIWPDADPADKKYIGKTIQIGKALADFGLISRRTRRGPVWARPPNWKQLDTRDTKDITASEARDLATQAVAGAEMRSSVDLQRLVPVVVPPVLQAICEVVFDRSQRPGDRLQGAALLLDRILGKTTQNVTVEVREAKQMSTIELEQYLSAETVES